ncbi:ABC transporter permease subunit [Pseudogemmobacter sonorensis]|uniref:ABC transporter permease subunit n=1 Tax=Pseudogemmobacter sonorensis TaxID=2989681 RepID=UPI0036A55116
MRRPEPNSLAVQLGLAALAGPAALWLVAEGAAFHTMLNATTWMVMAIFTLSLCLTWGVGGILCFGQGAFLGLGAYAYAIAAINLGDSGLAALIGLAVPALFAAMLGYFLFYGRLSDVYLGVITLTVTLILFKFMNATGGDGWRIGAARLGGFNGIPATPPLQDPFSGRALSPQAMFWLTGGLLILSYILVRLFAVSKLGREVIAVRENEVRAELLGYNSRALKLVVWVIGAMLAGLAGVLFATTVFVSPTLFSLATSAQVLIWVVVGGIGCFLGPVVACIALQVLTAWLGKAGLIDPNIALGALLVLMVLLLPNGLQPLVARLLARIAHRPAPEAAR